MTDYLSLLQTLYSPEELNYLLDQPASAVRREVDIVLAEGSFAEFCRQAWPLVEPGRPLVWGWHLQAKCDHLQAVYNHTVPPMVDPQAKAQIGIPSLIVNEPPRCSKSLFTSVLFPAWVWSRWPGARFLCITYADDLAERDALKCRNLVHSSWYRERWPGREIREVDEVTGKRHKTATKRYDLGSEGGYRVSTTILGMATGEGGDFRIIDDPHNVKKALSDAERKQANTFFDLTLPTRVVDPKLSSTIICMQRLHQDDLTGHALSGENPWDLLCLPMEYDARHGNRCRTALGFVDPRGEDGELLHPERWDRASVERAKNDLRMEFGDFGVDSQFQQEPTPIGGGMFKPGNLVMLRGWPDLRDLDKIVRYWDKAATHGSGCYTSGALMAKNRVTQRTVILDVVRGQWDTDEREAHMQATAHQDCRRLGLPSGSGKYAVRVEQEPGSGGKDSARFTVKGLAGFNVKAIPKTKSKEVDWLPISAQVNAGAVEMVEGPWNKETRDQMKNAPFGKYKDDLDALAGGFNHIWLGKDTWVA